MYWDEISFLKTSTISLRIIKVLSDHLIPLTPTEISKKANIARSNVSTKLIHLKKRGLVECVTPQRRKGRLYKLTKKGRLVIGAISSDSRKQRKDRLHD